MECHDAWGNYKISCHKALMYCNFFLMIFNQDRVGALKLQTFTITPTVTFAANFNFSSKKSKNNFDSNCHFAVSCAVNSEFILLVLYVLPYNRLVACDKSDQWNCTTIVRGRVNEWARIVILWFTLYAMIMCDAK